MPTDSCYTTTVKFSALAVGDLYQTGEHIGLVCGEHEPYTDQLGRAGYRFWARCPETNREGWQSYGPNGVCRVKPRT